MGGTSPPSDAEKAGNKIDCHVAQLSWRDSRPSEWRQPCRPREGKGEGAPSLLSLWGCCHVGERLSADMRRIYSSPRVLLSAVALLVTRAAGADFYRDLNVRRSATAADIKTAYRDAAKKCVPQKQVHQKNKRREKPALVPHTPRFTPVTCAWAWHVACVRLLTSLSQNSGVQVSSRQEQRRPSGAGKVPAHR